MTERSGILVLGIGNLLMGDEGVGVHVIRQLEKASLPAKVTLLDGGTGSFTLLDPMRRAGKILLIDATVDENPPGSVRRLTPRFSSDYPRTITAHDIGLKDLLDAFYLLGETPDVVLFAVSIPPLQQLGLELSPPIAACVPAIADLVRQEVANSGDA
jgi:hydrogenase maturation protease